MLLRKFIITVLLFFLFSINIYAQTLDWVKGVGGVESEYGASIAVDGLGCVYTTGFFKDTVDFDPNTGVMNLISAGDRDAFVQKLDQFGNLIWAKKSGGIGLDEGRSIKIDDAGNVYILGLFNNTVDFDPNIGTVVKTSNGLSDVFIQKLDSSGNLLWVKTFGGSNFDSGYDIELDDYGNLYTIGIFAEIVDFDPNVGVYNMGLVGFGGAFLQKLDSSGNFIWAKSIICTQACFWGVEPHAIDIDNSNNIYINGGFSGTVDFDPGLGVSNLTSISTNSKNMYIQKLNSSGNFVWAKMVGSWIASPFENTLVVDDFGNVYNTGSFKDTVDFDPNAGVVNLYTTGGSAGIFIQKLDSAGNYVWAKSMTGPNSQTAMGNAIATDGAGNIYTAGAFKNTVDFDPNIGVANLTTSNTFSTQIYVQKLDPFGNYLWAKTMRGGPIGFHQSTSQGVSLAVNGKGNIHLTGAFSGSVNFQPDTGTAILNCPVSQDFFIQKLNHCSPVSDIDVISACKSYTWINGITYYSSNNSAKHTLTNIVGCDSVVNLSLTIDTVDVNLVVSPPNIIANATGVSYRWLDCDNNYTVINGETSQSFTATTIGNYAVEINDNGCIDTSLCVTISTLSISDFLNFNKVSITPNPSQGFFNINLGGLKNVAIKVLNISGQLIHEKTNINKTNYILSLNQPSGFYFLEIYTGVSKKVFKLIIN